MVRSVAKKLRDKQASKISAEREAFVLYEMRRDGLTCANCEHLKNYFGCGDICTLKSDFDGNVKVKPSHLCVLHKQLA